MEIPILELKLFEFRSDPNFQSWKPSNFHSSNAGIFRPENLQFSKLKEFTKTNQISEVNDVQNFQFFQFLDLGMFKRLISIFENFQFSNLKKRIPNITKIN